MFPVLMSPCHGYISKLHWDRAREAQRPEDQAPRPGCESWVVLPGCQGTFKGEVNMEVSTNGGISGYHMNGYSGFHD